MQVDSSVEKCHLSNFALLVYGSFVSTFVSPGLFIFILYKSFGPCCAGKTCDTVDECAMEWEHQMAPLTIPCQCPIHSAW